MGTQGVVSVQSSGRVVMKLVAGKDGNLAQEVADCLCSSWPLSVDAAYDLALDIGFGSENTLVVLTESETRYDGPDELDDRYHRTLQDPNFNPRWELGTADHVVIIEV